MSQIETEATLPTHEAQTEASLAIKPVTQPGQTIPKKSLKFKKDTKSFVPDNVQEHIPATNLSKSNVKESFESVQKDVVNKTVPSTQTENLPDTSSSKQKNKLRSLASTTNEYKPKQVALVPKPVSTVIPNTIDIMKMMMPNPYVLMQMQHVQMIQAQMFQQQQLANQMPQQ